MNNKSLNQLIASGDITSYQLTLHDEDGNLIEKSKGSRETERLVLTFPSGKILTVDTFCSGCAENTCLVIQ
jgi:hypothetical protein